MIIYAVIWWAAEIAAGVFLGYKAAIFGVLMSVFTAGMLGWIVKEGKG